MSRSTEATQKDKAGRDVGWEHGYPIENNRYASVCKYCRHTMRSGGVSRLKEHLAGGFKNVKACPSVPRDVREEMRALLSKSKAIRVKRQVWEDEIREELRGKLGRVEEEDDVEEVFPDEDLIKRERADYRRGVRESVQQEWETDQLKRFEASRPSFQGSRREAGGGSGAAGPSLGRSQSTHVQPSGAGPKQRGIKSMFTKGFREKVGYSIARWFIGSHVPANAAASPLFQNMIEEVQRHGEGVKPPTPQEILGVYLDKMYDEMQHEIQEQKKDWELYGVTLMCDGWTGPTKLSIINFMAYCKGHTVFLKSIDSSHEIKNTRYIHKLLKDTIVEVGVKNVVQIVTDNGSAFKAAGKKLMKRRSLYWTPCAAHCIDLMLEDIGKREWVKNTIMSARRVTNFIYSHSWLLARMREECHGDIVRPGATRFATNFIALDSLIKHKVGLRNLFNLREYSEWKQSESQSAQAVEKLVRSTQFWEKVRDVVSILHPIYKVLRAVDVEIWPTMGSMYELVRLMKAGIRSSSLTNYQWILKIIDDRWESTLMHPLHKAAFFLNPKYHYSRRLWEENDLKMAIHEVYDRLFPESPEAANFGNELLAFKDARGLFASMAAVRSRDKMMPCEWWAMYGLEVPTLQKLAIKVLAQTVSSSPCERNWSTWSLIHTNRRNRLGYEKLQKLVFCHYNMKLKERVLREARSTSTEIDPLNLMAIGEAANLDDTQEDPLYEWVKSADLDDAHGGPNPSVAEGATTLGIDVDEVMEEQRHDDIPFEPLMRDPTPPRDVADVSDLYVSREYLTTAKQPSWGSDRLRRLVGQFPLPFPLRLSIRRKAERGSAIATILKDDSAVMGTIEEDIEDLGIFALDPALKQCEDHFKYRLKRYVEQKTLIEKYEGSLEEFAQGYLKFGFNREQDGIVYREWAPAAQEAQLIGDFNGWDGSNHRMEKNQFGVWTIKVPDSGGNPAIPHNSRVKFRFKHGNGIWVDRIPAWIKYATVDAVRFAAPYDGVHWEPPPSERYQFKYASPPKPKAPRIYEAHVGMSSSEPRINSHREFADDVLPRIKSNNYNTVQLMAIMEHSYYASFGYHVTNFFAVSSRSGTPEDLKYLIDKAHSLGLRVLMDVVHSHASNNVTDGLNGFDVGQSTQESYFHTGPRGYHELWDSRLFNYGNWEVLRFLLSNLRWWLEEYKFDGFRFDGVTSMLYHRHGINMTFTGNYAEYFSEATDVDAVVYLMLANHLIHNLLPGATVVAEDVSGMPALGRPVSEGGVGFDYRLAMAIPDLWIDYLKNKKDDQWSMKEIVSSLTNRRYTEKCISYAESHDQAIVGDKTMVFLLIDKDMYTSMSCLMEASPVVDRGIALHKMIHFLTMALGGEGYLNFMGNEFGHPEWIDFPREGNGWSYDKCRRQWELVDTDHLRYKFMNAFDSAMNALDDSFSFLASTKQIVSSAIEEDKVIVFERGDLVFVFNFHPEHTYEGYKVGCDLPGKYRVALDSDAWEFGGPGRVAHDMDHFTSPEGIPGKPETNFNNRPNSFKVLSPARTCVVYYRVEEDPEAVHVEKVETNAAVEELGVEESPKSDSEQELSLEGDRQIGIEEMISDDNTPRLVP